jgi:hypothetical protein
MENAMGKEKNNGITRQFGSDNIDRKTTWFLKKGGNPKLTSYFNCLYDFLFWRPRVNSQGKILTKIPKV